MTGEPLPCFPLALVVAEGRGPRAEACGCRFWIGGLGESRAYSADGVAIVQRMPQQMVIHYDVTDGQPKGATP